MDSSYKTGVDGTETNGVRKANKKTISSSTFFLRFLAIATTLVSIIVMAVSKQSKTVPLTLIPNLPPFNVEVTAKWQYLSAFKFFMVTNIIACIYATASLICSMISGTRPKLGLTLIVLDLMIMALLFAANGAAAAVGLLGYNGNSHLRWNKVCNVFGHYCHHVAGSLVVSLIGALAFFLLIVLTTMRLHRRSG